VETSFVPRKYAIRTQDRALVLYEPATWRELYDLGEDLAERHNPAAERPEEVAALEAQLAEWAEGNAWARVDFAGDEEAPRHWMSDVGISEDTRDQLKALGYLR
jgi:hypothetical protein